VSGTVKKVTSSLPSGSTRTPSAGTALGGSSGSGYTGSVSGNSTIAPIFGGTPGGPGGGGLTGPGGFTGGGPGSPGTLAFGIPRRPGGPGGPGGTSAGLDAFAASVASLAGCFYSLTPFEQQVLIVRTGLDGRQPLTRSQLAKALGTSPKAIGRTESGALRRLKTASLTDGCMPVAQTSALTAFIGGPFGPLGSVTPAVAPGARIPSGSGGGPALASTSFAERLSGIEGEGQAGPLWAALVLALLLATALGALGREWRRSVY
jgi:hypothetical protein